MSRPNQKGDRTFMKPADSTISPHLAVMLGYFCGYMLRGDLTCPASIAYCLEKLTEQAWAEALELYPPSTRID